MSSLMQYIAVSTICTCCSGTSGCVNRGAGDGTPVVADDGGDVR